jgi:hypothetical protein
MAKKQKELIQTKTEDLLVELNEKEIDMRARDMAGKAGQLNRAREEKKLVVADHNSRIKKLEEAFDKLAETVREGRELRPIVVEVWADYKRGSITEIRQDTSEQINERAMHPEERQGDLVGATTGPTPKSVAKKLFDDGVRPEDVGIEKKIEEAASADGGAVEAAAVLDSLVELVEEAEEKKAKK